MVFEFFYKIETFLLFWTVCSLLLIGFFYLKNDNFSQLIPYESYYMIHIIPQILFNIELEIDVIPFDNLSHIIGNIIHFQRQWCKS